MDGVVLILQRKHHLTSNNRKKNIFQYREKIQNRFHSILRLFVPQKNTQIDLEEKHEYFDFLLTFAKNKKHPLYIFVIYVIIWKAHYQKLSVNITTPKIVVIVVSKMSSRCHNHCFVHYKLLFRSLLLS